MFACLHEKLLPISFNSIALFASINILPNITRILESKHYVFPKSRLGEKAK